MNKKIALINGKKFLIQSELKLSKIVQLLGFFQTSSGWSKHVVAVDLTYDEYQALEFID